MTSFIGGLVNYYYAMTTTTQTCFSYNILAWLILTSSKFRWKDHLVIPIRAATVNRQRWRAMC